MPPWRRYTSTAKTSRFKQIRTPVICRPDVPPKVPARTLAATSLRRRAAMCTRSRGGQAIGLAIALISLQHGVDVALRRLVGRHAAVLLHGTGARVVTGNRQDEVA